MRNIANFFRQAKGASLLLWLFATSIQASAKVWIVDPNPGNGAKDFASLNEATASAQVQNGDTLYCVGSNLSHTTVGNLSIQKRLAIFGPGYYLTQNPNTQASGLRAFTSAVIAFGAGSAGSSVKGMTFGNNVSIQTNDLVMQRNLFIGNLSITDGRTNITVAECFFDGATSVGTKLVVNQNGTNIIVRNCFISAPSAVNSASNSAITLTHCTIRGSVTIANSVFTNNIQRDFTLSATNCVISHNVFNNSSTQITGSGNSLSNNIDIPSMNGVFIGGDSPDAQFQVQSNSPAKTAGVGGVECGMFGGALPYTLSGIPSIPTIYEFSAPEGGSTSLPVQVKIKSRN